MASEKAIDALLAEYSALRTEADQYSQRIDRIVSVYLAALFAVSGYLLRPDGTIVIEEYAEAVQASRSQMALYVFLTILNSSLIIRLVSFFIGILSIAQYTHYFIRVRLADLTNEDVLRWDDPPKLSAKKAWLPLRTASQAVFIIVVEFLTVFILLKTNGLLSDGPLFIAFYIVGWLFFLASLAALVIVLHASIRYHHN